MLEAGVILTGETPLYASRQSRYDRRHHARGGLP